MTILEYLLGTDPRPAVIGSVEDWWRVHRAIAFEVPVDVALAGGFAADRLGWAFASGYQAGGRALFGGDGEDRPTALCATETGGAHPRAIETTLTSGGLTGHKTYVTLGTFAERLLVLANEGVDAEGKKKLRLVRVDARADGVTIEPLPPAPFVPEIPHAQVRLDRVRVGAEDVLPGDGWNDYVKPFRTVEDCHVHAALLGWLLQIARRFSFPPEVIETALSLSACVRTLATADPRSVATHRALAGMIEASHGLLRAMDPHWAEVEEATRARFERDRPLLSVAGKARAARLAAARERS